MAHTHEHQHANHENIKIAFLLNFGFAIAELLGGLYDEQYSHFG